MLAAGGKSMCRRRIAPAAAAVLIAGSVAGCGDDLGIERRHPNRPPETRLTAGPPDSTNSTNYRVRLSWSGSDPDGTVDHFDYILMDHAASDSTITGEPGDPNQVIVRMPEFDDPRWTSTTAIDTLIVTRADTLRRELRPDPDDPNDSNEVVRQTTFERWHTFFVRAVDNEGVEDRTPEYRTFNARTLAPTISLRVPAPLGWLFTVPTPTVFSWDGEDPVGDGTFIEPVAARWVVVPLRRTYEGFFGYPDSLYYLPRGISWSPWFAWDRSDGKGRSATVSLDPNYLRQGYYMFAVQALDEAGAVTPVFDAFAPGKNNVAMVRASASLGATLQVSDRSIGTATFVRSARPQFVDAAAGQPIEFHWLGDASAYGGQITHYRYAWNILNPGNDEEWEQGWARDVLQSTPRTFQGGTQRFYLQCRDNAGVITGVEIVIDVHQVTRSKDILFVDDTEQPGEGLESLEDARWRAVLDSLVARRPSIDFHAGRDIYDVVSNRYPPPPLSKIFDYKTIVWAVVQGRSGSALRTLGHYFDPFLNINHGQMASFNYLNVYLDAGGEIWVSGDQPGHVIWPVLRQQNIDLQLPVNVTHWDDPVQLDPPHPDSAGVNSLLYRLGVEIFDIGGGGRAPRPRRDRIIHYCSGFRRAILDSLNPSVAEFLYTDSLWPRPVDSTINPHRARPNIEIYNMLVLQSGPLVPPPGLSLPLYLYQSGVPASSGVHWPQTADGTPAVILRKNRITDANYSRALCGFEPWLLRFDSHLALADAILLRHMRLGLD